MVKWAIHPCDGRKHVELRSVLVHAWSRLKAELQSRMGRQSTGMGTTEVRRLSREKMSKCRIKVSSLISLPTCV